MQRKLKQENNRQQNMRLCPPLHDFNCVNILQPRPRAAQSQWRITLLPWSAGIDMELQVIKNLALSGFIGDCQEAISLLHYQVLIITHAANLIESDYEAR